MNTKQSTVNSKISLFAPFSGGSHTSNEEIELWYFLACIRSGEWIKQVEAIRSETDKNKRQELKRGLPSVTISGTFSERKQDKLIEHSGFIQIDIDGEVPREQLQNDPYIFGLFLSVSGNGLCGIVKIKPEKHKESFRWLQEYFYKTYGISIDPAPQNQASLRYVSYDPLCYVNEKSKVSGVISRKPKKHKSIPIVLPESELSELVSEIRNSGKDIAPDYETYLHLSFSLSSLGEQGRDYFHAVCMASEKYNREHADKQFDIALKRGRNDITIGTFYHIVKEAGFDIKSDTQQYIRSIAIAKSSGRSPLSVKKQLKDVSGLSESQAKDLVDSTWDRADIDIKDVTKDISSLIDGILEWVLNEYGMKKNEITQKLEDRYGNIYLDEQLRSVWLNCARFFNSKDVTMTLVNNILFSSEIPVYNPLKGYFEGLKWDGVSRLDDFVNHVNTDTNGADIFIRKWLLSIMAALYGHSVRSVLVFTGKQHTGKTEFFLRLLPKQIKKYFAVNNLDKPNDSEMLMCERLIILDDEFGGKSKQDEKRLKALTSGSVFTLRAPYGRSNMDYKRLAVLCGTTNDKNIINDPTGNTRILPVNVLSIDFERGNAIDREQLWAEVKYRYDQGEEWKLSKEEFENLSELTDQFESIPFEYEVITKHFSIPENSMDGEYMTSTDILNYIQVRSQHRIMSLNRFGTCLRKIFGEPERRIVNGARNRVFFVKKVDDDNIKTEEVPF